MIQRSVCYCERDRYTEHGDCNVKHNLQRRTGNQNRPGKLFQTYLKPEILASWGRVAFTIILARLHNGPVHP